MHEATISRPACGVVYLAVGDDSKQSLLALQWASHSIPPHMSLVLVHVHRQATMIPMGLGASIQASMLREDLVSAYRKNERSEFENTLMVSLQICKVQAEILIIDHDDVVVALLELIKEHKITTVIMGAKNRQNEPKSKTGVALEKQGDPSCDILYLHDGILVSSRHQHQHAKPCIRRKTDIPSLGGHHFSGNSNTTTSKSSSFFNSRSTVDTFEAERLDDPSLVMNTTYIYNDSRFNAIIGLESLTTFRQLVNQDFCAERSRDLYQEFHNKYCDIFNGCQFIGGFDSVIGVDHQNLGEAHWKCIKSWPAVLEYIVSVLNTLDMQLLGQNHHTWNGFTQQKLSDAAELPIRRLFTVASIISNHEVRKSPEKLFCIVNMYTSLLSSIPTLRRVFYTESICSDAEELLAILKGSTRKIIEDLKRLIQDYNSNKSMQDGSILLITRYLMRYITLLVKHKGSLDNILGHVLNNDLLKVEEKGSTHLLVSELITGLESVHQKHSELFSSKGLQCIFLMNSTDFILQEAKQSDIQLILGAKWVDAHQNHIKGYMKSYLTASWEPITYTLVAAKSMPHTKSLRTTLLNFLYTGVTPLQSFAWSFNETCNTQMCWKVPSPTLRNKLRAKIQVYVAKAYHGYLGNQKQTIGRNAKDFKLEWRIQISELFEG